MNYVKISAILILIFAVLIMPVSAFTQVAPIIDRGATLFIGEEGLNLTPVLGSDGGTIAFWKSGSNLLTTSPDKTISITPGMANYYTISESDFSGYTGPWYELQPNGTPTSAFWVVNSRLDVSVWSADGINNLDGKTVSPGQLLTFRVSNNLYQMSNRYDSYPNKSSATLNKTKGFINLRITSPNGGSYTSIISLNNTAVSVQDIFVDNPNYIWQSQWNTSAVNKYGQKIYAPGVYTVSVESTLNNMNNNVVLNRTGNVISSDHSIEIGSDSLSIIINQDSVMKNKPFSVTVIGSPNAYYNLWIKDTNQMTGGINNQPPSITDYQEGVSINDPITANYTYQNGHGKTISQNVLNNGPYYANITTNSAGSRTIQFDTGTYTKAQKYTIHVEQIDTSGNYKFDEVVVQVKGGEISIVAKDYQNFYIGETINLYGENTNSMETFLFITGPNLPSNGAQIDTYDPRNYAVENTVRSTFHIEDVNAGKWEWDWNTATLSLDSGTYTIYAVSTPNDRSNLQGTSYATLSITIKKPYISATTSQPSIAKGDSMYIRGTAEGNPSSGIQIWIIGKNYAKISSQYTDEKSTFEYEIDGAQTSSLTSGQYFVVVQHPMQNGQFDIIVDGNGYVKNLQLNANATSSAGLSIFRLTGSGSLQGTDAAEALVKALDDQNIDDTYTRLQFIVEEPVIIIDPIGNKQIGDKFTITGKTNLAVDDEINIEIYSSSFKPTEKLSSGEFSGATGTVKVTKGDAKNIITFEVDASTFKEDEYIVTASAITIDATGTSVFNVYGMKMPTGSTNTTINQSTVTIAPPTPAPTIATPSPTPVPTSKPLPGFGAVLALSGLVIIGFIIVRRK